MNIAFTTPNYWPYVRRGTARYISTLTKYLIEKGHKVTIITTKPGSGREVVREGYQIRYLPNLQHPLVMKRINRIQMFTLSAFWSLCRDSYDVVYCMHFPDGFAAHLASTFRKLRYMLNITSVPLSKYWGDSRINKYMFRKSIDSANGLLLPSKFAASHMQERYGVTGKVIPMPVDMDHFSESCEKDLKNPKILFVSDLTDRRKGLSLLLQAFYRFRKEVPGSTLLLAGQTDRYTNKWLLDQIPREAQSSIKILGQGRLEDLPLLYAQAAMTVLPSMYEVFGMVLLESLASGTPVVGCNSGAIPEIVTSPAIGRLFEPEAEGDVAMNADGLYEAMMDVFGIARKEDTSVKCREYARQYDISITGERIESYLKSISIASN
jgi:phosphatidylinositol alpha-mannosyltransferase